MTNKANCQTCKYKNMIDTTGKQHGHCYMFRHEPDETCMQWQTNTLHELAVSLPDFMSAIGELIRRIK